jgi:hypothetical protein
MVGELRSAPARRKWASAEVQSPASEAATPSEKSARAAAALVASTSCARAGWSAAQPKNNTRLNTHLRMMCGRVHLVPGRWGGYCVGRCPSQRQFVTSCWPASTG